MIINYDPTDPSRPYSVGRSGPPSSRRIVFYVNEENEERDEPDDLVNVKKAVEELERFKVRKVFM